MGLVVLGNHVALDPGSGDRGIVRHFVFFLAGFDTKAAAYAFIGVDHKAPPCALFAGCGFTFGRAEESEGRDGQGGSQAGA